jgi:hypothetical protein
VGAVNCTIVSALYGDGYEAFVADWAASVHALDPAPERVILATDRKLDLHRVQTLRADCDWRHPQAFYLNLAVEWAETEWVWIVDIDDFALPDGLDGIEDVDADVWAVGFDRSDGVVYLPPPLTPESVLAAQTSVIPGSSMFRTDVFREAGGFRDVALQDWALWRSLARVGARFESSGRPHFRYMRHPGTRGETELTVTARPEHLAEMLDAEMAAA